MLWKIQSGIVPPLFYLIIAEKDKLKALKEFMCPQNVSKDLRIIMYPKITLDMLMTSSYIHYYFIFPTNDYGETYTSLH